MYQAESDGVELFIPKTYDLVWSFVVLLIVEFFFYKYFMPKFNAVFDERAEKIEGRMKKAKKAEEEAEEKKKEYEEQLNNARIEASQICEKARGEANQIVSQARVRAQAEADQIMTNAEKSIESGRRQAMVNLKSEVGTLAVSLAGKIIGEQLKSDSVQKSVIDSMIDGLEESESR